METQHSPLPPASIVGAFGFSGDSEVQPVEGGLINQTFRLREGTRQVALQRLHKIFAPEVNLDIDAITRHLAHKGLLTPRVVPTRDGALWSVDADGFAWRALSWLEGRTLHVVAHPATARAAADRAARFHAAVSDLPHSFHFTRPLAHDLEAHLTRLQQALGQHAQHANYERVAPLAAAILEHAAALAPLPTVPTRLIHGDLKISNLLFEKDRDIAIALLDLDTMANLTIPVELGDALRSWCNPAGEEESRATFRADIFEAAIAGYAEASPDFLTREEVASLVLGAQTIALELSARFCADALQESYFGWSPKKFPSRSEHNRIRASSQLSVATSIETQRSTLEQLVSAHFA
ncbi:MAG: hypothetical protein JWN04_2287 [Myxococcaceae bacterium]|nr:hypothetical protein [Myxococcaceae bacterium]